MEEETNQHIKKCTPDEPCEKCKENFYSKSGTGELKVKLPSREEVRDIIASAIANQRQLRTGMLEVTNILRVLPESTVTALRSDANRVIDELLKAEILPDYAGYY